MEKSFEELSESYLKVANDLALNENEAVFWVNVDSLNVADSLELSYNSAVESAYANDVFPTNRSYSLVWHFGNPLSPMADYSEYGYFDGRLEGPIGLDAMVDGVLGAGVCDALFGDMNVYAMANGFPVWANLLLVIIDEVDRGVTEEQGKMPARIRKYSQKYKR